MHILQVNTLDSAGGAEKIAWQLLHGYRLAGHESRLLAAEKRTQDPHVIPMVSPPDLNWTQRLVRTLSLRWHRELGREFFDWPAMAASINALPPPDVLQLHNLHGFKMGYFDLRLLPALSRRFPLVLTLHDAWLLSGHCAHSFECERWKTGCGHCPDLKIYPRIKRDGTARNWKAKQAIYAKSRLHVATPSHWLMRKVEQSMLATGIVEAKVIPNGVDLKIFQPADQRHARELLNLPLDARILLFTANGIRENAWKDFGMLRKAIAILAERWKGARLLFVALGEDAPDEQVGSARIQFAPFEPSPERVARYYQAADIYLHAARADTFPTVVLEALSCGCPVAATRVGGIPDQIEEGVCGELTPPGDPEALAASVCGLLENPGRRQRMAAEAADRALRLYGVDRQVQNYLAWFHGMREPSAKRLIK